MRNHHLGAKCLLLGILLVLLGAIYSRQGAAAARGSLQPPEMGQPHAPRSAGARPTLTPGPTEGPPRPSLCERRPAGQPVLAECLDRSADIYLRLSTDPGGAIPPASIATYQLTAYNSGHGDAAGVRITLPFASDVQTPLDATLSDSSAWVSAVLSDAIELRLETLRHGQTISATLRLYISPSAPLGRDLGARARLRWGGRGKSQARVSNLAPLVIASAPMERHPAALAIEPVAGAPATTFVASYHGFASHERVSLWYHASGGGAVGLGHVQADRQGRIEYQLAASALGAGTYTVVAAGQYSQVSAVGAVTVGEAPATPTRQGG